MTIECKICFQPFTSPHTKHAPYSTSCGHLVGKECLDKLKKYPSELFFICPFCKEVNSFAESHPIYGISDESQDKNEKVLDDIMLNKFNTNGNFKETKKFVFLKDYNQNIRGNIKFFDEHNEYILIGGESFSLVPFRQFIKIIDIKERKVYNISNFSKSVCTCLAFNKHKNDVIEFCAGFKDGTIKWFTCSIVYNCLTRISTDKLENLNYKRLSPDKSIIHSLCFLTKDKVIFSIGKQEIRVWDDKNETSVSQTKIVRELHHSECNGVVDFKSTKHGVCLGIINDIIFVFEKDGTSYDLLDETEFGRPIISYSIDPDFSKLLVFYSDKIKSGKNNLTCKSHIMYEIKKKKIFDKEIPIFEKYVAIKLGSSSNYKKKFPKSFRTPFFSVENFDTLIHYGFLPNIKKGKIEITSLCDELQCEESKKIRNLKNCLGVTFTNPNQFCLKTNSRNKIIVVLRSMVKIMEVCFIDKS